jgi:hypothetical protein
MSIIASVCAVRFVLDAAFDQPLSVCIEIGRGFDVSFWCHFDLASGSNWSGVNPLDYPMGNFRKRT